MINTIVTFLKDLSVNNNREWFAENKFRYEASRSAFISLVTSLHKEISVFDENIRILDPKECIFRIFRDVRFSKDKSPYKTNFGAYMNLNGKKVNNGGYYFHLEPGNSFLCGGIYMPQPSVLKLLRQDVYYNFDEFNRIISEKKFKDYFGDVSGSKLQRLPPEFPKEFRGAEYLKLKDYLAMHPYDPEQFNEKELIAYVAKVFRAMKPLNDFLNRAVSF